MRRARHFFVAGVDRILWQSPKAKGFAKKNFEMRRL
jgi:hypothetical protein